MKIGKFLVSIERKQEGFLAAICDTVNEDMWIYGPVEQPCKIVYNIEQVLNWVGEIYESHQDEKRAEVNSELMEYAVKQEAAFFQREKQNEEISRLNCEPQENS